MAKRYAPFQFKHFALAHQQSAHKIGTDSIVLATWLKGDSATKVLDFGSGCGLISFICAQRFPDAEILGIEIDQASYQESLKNKEQNPFSDRLRFLHQDLQALDTETKYELIVSNPPYFINGLQAPKANRAQARHSDASTFWTWMKTLSNLLSEDGKLALVLPPDLWHAGAVRFQELGLSPIRICRMQHDAQSPVKRILVELSFEVQTSPKEERLILYQNPGSLERSRDFQALVEEILV